MKNLLTWILGVNTKNKIHNDDPKLGLIGGSSWTMYVECIENLEYSKYKPNERELECPFTYYFSHYITK